MSVVRRRLFWKIYLTLLASLVAASIFMGAFFWLLGEAQRDGVPDGTARKTWPSDVSVYAADGHLVASRGEVIAFGDDRSGRHWGPGHVLRLDLPDGRIMLTRFAPPARARITGILRIMLVVVGGVGLAAYPVTTRLTRRLEVLRAGMASWGEGVAAGPLDATPLDARGDDEVALLARTFNSAAARLAALLAAQKSLLANASHELRSPLARLRLAVEVAVPHASAAHGEIVRNLAEMDQLVDELLLSSRLNHNEPRQVRREPVDLLGLAAEEGARHDATVSGEAVEIMGDPVLLRRMMRNLFENAAKHGRPPIVVTVARYGTGAEIVVGDAGAGIAGSDLERVFEPFYRPAGHGETSGGWGLGLALVRQIAARHGGSARCEPVREGGSRFVVQLSGA